MELRFGGDGGFCSRKQKVFWLPEEELGHFYTGECYEEDEYGPEDDSKPPPDDEIQCVVYFWQGRDAGNMDCYLPVVMARAWLPWREDDFAGAEREFRSSAEFCSETPVWRLHAAHVLFMRGDKYKEAAAFYEPIVRQNFDDILSVSAAVLANLCVSYIMTFQNEEAEELMRKVEKAEDQKGNANGQFLHLCTVVGTLYCAKSNYEFGLSRIAHALEGGSGPRLCADTWLHVKRCVLDLLTGLAKQIVVLPSSAIQEVVNFLKTCEVYGLLTPSTLTNPLNEINEEPSTIGLEARKLRCLLLKLIEYE